MNKLDTTTRKLEVLLDATVSTTACDFTVSYRDENRNAPQSLGAVPSATYPGTVSSLTVVTLLPAPTVNTIVRVPERMTFKNRDTTTRIPTFRLNDNATTYQYCSPSLLTGESFFWEEGRGWYATDANGNLKESLSAASNWAVSGNLTVAGNTTLGDASADSLTVNAGTLSMPNIPCFAAYKSSTTNNQTGNGASYTMVPDTEIFDQGNNFNNGTGVFTAPTTGRYIFSGAFYITGCTIATRFTITFVTSNRNWTANQTVRGAVATDECVPFTIGPCDMDAADTASVAIVVVGEAADTDDIFGTTAPATFFCGIQAA